MIIEKASSTSPATMVTGVTLSAPCHNLRRLAAACIVAALPTACADLVGPPPNPFLGAWATAERQKIDFRDDTVVINPPSQPPTAMGKESCAGRFRFGYTRKSREAIAGLIRRQPDLYNRLAVLLVRADYPVAELGCDHGDNTYILLGDRDVVAIYRDGDVAGLERLSRL